MKKFNSIRLLLLGNACILISIATNELYRGVSVIFLLIGGVFSLYGFFLPVGKCVEEQEDKKDVQRKEAEYEKDS